jgi:RNA polymerase sigma-70 factor (ECF subfamily)
MGWDFDRAAFDRLVLEHLPACQRFAVRLTGDGESAEEVVQEAMVRVARGWRSFRGEAKFQTWLFRIVINAWRDRHRGRERGEEIAEVEDRRGGGPVGEAVGRELGEAVAHAVGALPPRQREVVVMIVYEQMGIAEVAGVLGVTEQNVRTNLHFGRERLREKLRAYLPEEQRRDRR